MPRDCWTSLHVTEVGKMPCSSCGTENPQGLKFCNQCAAPFKKRCATCGFENSPTAKFCGDCAAPLSESAGLVRSTQESASTIHIPNRLESETVLDGERKT